MTTARLVELLVKLEAQLDRVGCPIETNLAPGRDPGDVRDRLAAYGMEAGDDLLTWFGWHDGLVDRWKPEPGLTDLVVTEFYSLDVALAEWEAKEKGDEPWEWPATWLPIGGLDAFNISVVCTQPAQERSLVTATFEAEPKGGADHTVLGIDTMVSWWIDAIESGYRRFLPDTNEWDIDFSVPCPLERRVSGLL